MQRFTAAAAITLGNIIAISPFLGAFIAPEDAGNFVYHTAIVIFVIEFLSVHSSVMIRHIGASHHKAGLLFLLVVYSVIALGFSAATNSYYPMLIFVVRLIAKSIVARKAITATESARLAQQGALFIVTVMLVVVSATFLSQISLPPELLAQRPAGTEGIFVETPQTLLAWGIIYYSLDTIMELYRLRRTNPI